LIVKEINANKNQSIKLINANNVLKLAKLRSQAIATKEVKRAEAYRDRAHKQADNEAAIIQNEAETRLGVSKNRSQALIKEATSEIANSNKIDPLRRFDEKMGLARSLAGVSSRGKMVVAGNNGQQVLNFYADTMSEIAGR